MKNRKVIAIIMLLVPTLVLAQQDPQFTHYVFNKTYYNAAASGIDQKINVQSIIRSQYLGYTPDSDPNGAPNTQILSISGPVSFLKGGVSLNITNDKLGPSYSSNEVQLGYAFHKKVGRNIFSIGVNGGAHIKNIDYQKLRPVEGDDPSIPSAKQSEIIPDIGAGVYLHNPNYALGLSVKHLNKPTFGLNSETGVNELKPNYYLNGSYLLGVTYSLDISPMFIVKSDLQNISADLGLLATYNNNYYGGLSYRTQDAVGLLLGGNFLQKRLHIGYAIDLVTFNTLAKAPTSHEIIIAYNLKSKNKSGKKSIIKTPRYSF